MKQTTEIHLDSQVLRLERNNRVVRAYLNNRMVSATIFQDDPMARWFVRVVSLAAEDNPAKVKDSLLELLKERAL